MIPNRRNYSDYENVDKNSDVVSPGTVLLTCKPFAYALEAKFADVRCDTCFKLDEKSGGTIGLVLSRCGACQQVKFCNRDCQRKGWSDGHKYECIGFKTQRRVAGSFSRLLLRIIVRLKKNRDEYDEVSRKRVRRRFMDLMSHFADLRNDKPRMERLLAMAEVVKSMLKHHSDINMPNSSELIGICGRIFVNTFSITDYENRTLGTGLYLGASIFDHSCEPLAAQSFESTEIVVRSIREFPKTLSIYKVTISYRDCLRPSYIRKKELLKSYYFECNCNRCANQIHDAQMQSVICGSESCDQEINYKACNLCSKCNWTLTPAYLEKLEDTEEMIKARVAEMEDNAYLDVAEACLRILKNHRFTETNWLNVEMFVIAFDGCIDMKLWEKAYSYGIIALKGYRKYLYKFDPALGIMLLRMAKLAWFLEHETEAKTFLTEAQKVLEVTHGRDSVFARKNIYPLAREIYTTLKMKNLF